MSKKICVIGVGHIGIVVSIGLADFGNTVIAVDRDEARIDQFKAGHSPIYEPGVEEYLKKHSNSEGLRFSSDISIGIAASDVIFIAVGTPIAGDGHTDLRYVNQATEDIAANLSSYKLIVLKSTVPVGSNASIKRQLEEKTGKKAGKDFDIVSNPEFLKEGQALQDFFHPDRVIIGCENSRARDTMADLYRPLQSKSIPFVWCNLETAELIKYANNVFLATKIAFINEIANLSETVGADTHKIREAMGLDVRISPGFLNPGPGYGGSCFPKDAIALIRTAEEYGFNMSIVKAVMLANEYQKKRMVEKLLALFQLPISKKQVLKGKTIGVLGLAFKQKTSDVRESPAIAIIKQLIQYGARVQAYDPQAMDNFSQIFSDIQYCDDTYSAAEDTDAILLLTEWDEFQTIDLRHLKQIMRGNIILDTRNLLDPVQAHKQGFLYQGVG